MAGMLPANKQINICDIRHRTCPVTSTTTPAIDTEPDGLKLPSKPDM